MRFQWHWRKAEDNIKWHGVSFEEAATVFGDPLAEIEPDFAHSVDEDRFLAFGTSEHMNYTIEILDDDSYDPTDDVEPEYDLPAIRERARREGREYRGILMGHLVRLAPDVAEFFKTAEAVNEALRRVMREMQDA